MPKVPIVEVRSKMFRALETRGLAKNHANLLADDFLDAELEKKSTHGLGKFLLMDELLANRGGPPRETRDSDAFALVDARKELGQIAATQCIDILKTKVGHAGVAMVGMVNFSRFGRLYPYGRMLADDGFVGIITNGGGPPAVSPHGGVEAMLGSNPVCFAFPTSDGPLVIDFSTGASVWGEIRQATLENRGLPEDVFLDRAGDFTTDPEAAAAVIPFGGPKGYALCLALEILSGALVTASMGPEVESQFDIGFLAIGIDPSAFGVRDSMKTEVDELLSTIRRSKPRDGVTAVHVPGDRARLQRERAQSAGVMDVADDTWSRLLKMEGGQPSGMSIK